MSAPIKEVTDVATVRRLAAEGALRATRERARLSQADVARAVSVTPAAVSRWEAGVRRPRGEAAKRLAALMRALDATG